MPTAHICGRLKVLQGPHSVLSGVGDLKEAPVMCQPAFIITSGKERWLSASLWPEQGWDEGGGVGKWWKLSGCPQALPRLLTYVLIQFRQ